MRSHPKPPSHYINKAEMHIEKQEWNSAIAALNSARAVSIGHKRRDRYEEWADTIAEQHGCKRHYDMYEVTL